MIKIKFSDAGWRSQNLVGLIIRRTLGQSQHPLLGFSEFLPLKIQFI